MHRARIILAEKRNKVPARILAFDIAFTDRLPRFQSDKALVRDGQSARKLAEKAGIGAR
jgi:hypothetical protein